MEIDKCIALMFCTPTSIINAHNQQQAFTIKGLVLICCRTEVLNGSNISLMIKFMSDIEVQKFCVYTDHINITLISNHNYYTMHG